jgi:hypothetical protein
MKKQHPSPFKMLPLVLLSPTISSLAFGQAAQTTAASGSPGVPRLVKFSGLLKDPSGNLLANTVGLSFAIYSAQTGGVPLWEETQNVQLGLINLNTSGSSSAWGSGDILDVSCVAR